MPQGRNGPILLDLSAAPDGELDRFGVVVGEIDKQSPELQASINGVLFNPPWHVPRSIITNRAVFS